MSGQFSSILIIGASGFLGSKLFSELSQQFQVVGTYYSRAKKGLLFLDVSDQKQVRELIRGVRPDLLIDCGGMTRPDACELDRNRAFQVNVQGVANLTEICKCKIIYFSTDYVFDGYKGQYTEQDTPHPINYYGWTKYEAEKIVVGADPNNVVLRVSGIYGYNKRNNEFLSTLMKPKIQKANNCYSSNLFLDDIIQYLDYFCSGEGVYHLTDGETLSRYEFSVKAINILGLPTQVLAESAAQLYTVAPRPRNSSLISVRHNLALSSSTSGLLHTRELLSFS